jgi:hypothetical protein
MVDLYRVKGGESTAAKQGVDRADAEVKVI